VQGVAATDDTSYDFSRARAFVTGQTTIARYPAGDESEGDDVGMKDLIANPLVVRALVVGIVGGVGLSLTSIYSRRGPMIYPAYAALLSALALLLARHSQTTYLVRASAALVGFATANFILYVTAALLANRQRGALVVEGHLPRNAAGVSLLGHAWRWAFLLGAGAIVSAALALISA
jgi:hypothetical protein